MLLYSKTLLKVSTLIKLSLGAAAVLLCIASAQADTIVKWGESGGDTAMLTATTAGQNKLPDTYNPATLVNPTFGAVGSGQYEDLVGQTRVFYGADNYGFGGSVFMDDGGGDYMQIVGRSDPFSAMVAWKVSDFITSVRTLESFSIEYANRGGTTTVGYLIETTAGWYQSDQTYAAGAHSVVVGDLTWSGFANSFGVTAGAGTTPDTTDILSVGFYVEGGNNGGWTGAKVEYFEVTETSPIVQTDATYTDVLAAAAVTSSTDLANLGRATFASSTVTANDSGTGTDGADDIGFNDGMTAEDFANMTWFLDGSAQFPGTVTLNLDVTTNTDGYNITEINSIAGWNAGTQAHQVMTVEYSVTNDAEFTTLGTFTNTSAGVGEYSRIGLTEVSAGYLATGVDALRFTYADPADTDRMVLQEIDVIGVPVPTLVATNYTYTLLADAQADTSVTDLANVGEATFASSTVSTNQGGTGTNGADDIGFNDGAASDSDFANVTWFHNGFGHLPAEVILNLDVSTYSNGYHISEINSIAGWGSDTQADQVMTVEYSVVGSAAWTQIGTGAFTNTDAGAAEYSRIHLDVAGYLATGVDALRFSYATTGNNLLLQEIDVIGDPIAVPLDLELSSMFSDDMILQREKAVPVWGTSAPGVGITVEFDGQTKMTTAAGDGTWMVNLDSMVASAVSRDFTVTADLNSDTEVVTFSNVLVGEVWVCSGQSNMALTIAQTVHKATVEATPTNATLRLFKVPQETPSTPLEQLNAVWTKSTTGSSGTARGFSAVAYYFGLKLQTELGVPVGLIQSARGGTVVEQWLPVGTSYNSGSAGGYYNGMIDALIPFAMRGVIWYQGESNLIEDGYAQPMPYLDKKKALINGWRSLWGEDFPFYYVQIAPYTYGDDVLPFFWEAQSAILDELTNTGMAVITDSVTDSTGATNLGELHPRNKEVPGTRLALLALDNTYGQNIVSTGPTFQSIRLVGNQVELTFDSAVGLTTSDSGAPDSFELAGADETYETATATVSGNKVILEAPGVAVPEAMRFAWSEIAQPNLRNAAGLVASSFRADVPVAAWSTWIGDNSLTSNDALPDADADLDGHSNLLEFAFGTDPAVSNSTSVAYGSGVTPGQPLLVLESSPLDFRAAFARRKDWQTSGLTYTVQFSADLTEWVDSADTPALLESGSGDIDAVYIDYPLGIQTEAGSEDAQFFRLSVSQD